MHSSVSHNTTQHCYEINLQTGLGGGEIYTRFFTQALIDLGWWVTLIAKRGSWLAGNLGMAHLKVIEVDDLNDVPGVIANDDALVFAHNPFSGEVAERIRQYHRLVCFAHMPLYGRSPAAFDSCDLILAVSRHVIDSLKAAGLDQYYPEPLYGVADMARGQTSAVLTQGSPYAWDTRKFRDWLLGKVYPFYAAVRPKRTFQKRPGLTLGIVSRLTPIKQWPQLFDRLCPVLAEHPDVNIEIFGSGGYASVRDLKRAIRPIRNQVRFWGHQEDVQRVYKSIDYLLTGLPEKEALGLNIIEAQMCGTPVLAVASPPFTETVSDRITGWLYGDPRLDDAANFSAVLERILAGTSPSWGAVGTYHLATFGQPAFTARVERVLASVISPAERANLEPR